MVDWLRPRTTAGTDTVKGRVWFLLLLVALLHFIYPMTLGGSTLSLIVYQLLYSTMFVAGILVAGDSPRHLLITVSLAVLWLLLSISYALDPTNRWKILATYAALLPFQATITLVLLRYIFTARRVTQDVLLAAVTVYLLLAAMFVPIYGALELLQPGSFVDNVLGAPVFWQQFIYYSLITLTTAGYGDIVPVSGWARALASAEAVIGVLYLAILLARLVGLYAQGER